MAPNIRDILRSLVPDLLLDGVRGAILACEARRLSRLANGKTEPVALVDAVWRFGRFRPLQRRIEIVRFLELVRGIRPAAVLEIGAASGGTTFLLSRVASPDSIVISIDLGFTQGRVRAVHSWAAPGQTLVCLARDSHRRETFQEVARLLGGRPLDLLFIDGDHSYAGVASDFSMFSPLVRSGGLIGFHDIIPDYKARFGIETVNWTGGVPEFWSQVRDRYPHEEIVENPDQDGYGLGVLRWVAI